MDMDTTVTTKKGGRHGFEDEGDYLSMAWITEKKNNDLKKRKLGLKSSSIDSIEIESMNNNTITNIGDSNNIIHQDITGNNNMNTSNIHSDNVTKTKLDSENIMTSNIINNIESTSDINKDSTSTSTQQAPVPPIADQSTISDEKNEKYQAELLAYQQQYYLWYQQQQQQQQQQLAYQQYYQNLYTGQQQALQDPRASDPAMRRFYGLDDD
jgi:hypothetical protein